MTDKIIHTLKTEARRPGRSLLLSLLFTGLGQMYNGELAKGVVFCLMRVVAIAALPVSVIRGQAAPSAVTALALAAAVLALTAAAPVEAFLRARRRADLPARAYCAPGWYCAFAAACAAVTAAAVLVFCAFFTAAVVAGAAAGPLLEEGDVVLVSRYRAAPVARGELLLAGGAPARVIALGGDAVRYEGNVFFVNGSALPLGFLPDRVIARFTSDRGDVISEAGATGKYPVRFRQSGDVTLSGIPATVPEGHLLVASDTRLAGDFARVVPLQSVGGRVEGVLFSAKLTRIGMNAFGGLRP
jgi:hypothetical protein